MLSAIFPFKNLSLFLVLSCLHIASIQAQSRLSHISGTITNEKGEALPGVFITIKSLSKGSVSDINGHYKLTCNSTGTHTLSVSYMGFHTVQKEVNLLPSKTIKLDIKLSPSTEQLKTVVVSAKSKLSEIEALAFNVDVLDTKKLEHTSLSTGEALNRIAGVRVRQSGGVGSAMNLSINGFRGKQVKVFIDGVPMDNFGSAFQLNNIPVNLAKRIEVYKGVVPIHLGADALGGAINIVTDHYKKTQVNLSYSFGSFNTHKSTVNATYVAKSGFITEFQAYQNYSDNDYWMNVNTADLETGEYYPEQRVRRFHDLYRNEMLIAHVGVINKSYADELLFGITLGQNYDEIQTGARVNGVFGALHTRGNIIMPSLKYKKSDFIIKNLDIKLSANYNFGKEKIIDTLHRRYNWLGDFIEESGPGGERSYSLYEYQNNNGVATANLTYQINAQQSLSLSNMTSTFNREGSDQLQPENDKYEHPQKTVKNILGLGYSYKAKNWSSSVFLKHYNQTNKFAQAYNPTGVYGDIAYKNHKSKFDNLGYGITGTYFITDNFQIKASYEKSYRLPSASELFGNLTTLEGNIELDPETSYNYNLGTSYWTNFNNFHQINLSANVFYRDAKDFIRARLNNNQVMQVMDNLFNVTNIGVSGEANYSYKNTFSIGTNFTYQNLRNNTKFVGGQTTENILYRDRVPNMPYLYGNLDASYAFVSPLNQKHHLRFDYHILYVHSFYLYWPSMGDPNRKYDIKSQISHDLSLTYTLGKTDNIKLTLACRNLTDNKLYDNFSLQKPGRSFSAKINYAF